MFFPSPYTLQQLAEIMRVPQADDPAFVAKGLNEIHRVQEGDIAFVDHPKYYETALESAASVVIIDQRVDEVPAGKVLWVNESPFDLFNGLIKHFLEEMPQKEAVVGEGTFIHPSASLGRDVVIGKNCKVGANTTIGDRSVVGDNVEIGAGCVLGNDAFYYKKKPTGFDKLVSCGNVVLEGYVELGACVTIDAGVTADTRIGEGTKIDNQVHIGHDCVIGKRCLFAAQVGIAGCVTIEDGVTLWGQVGVPANLTIGKGATALGQSGILGDVEAGKTVFGSPASEAREQWKQLASIRRLPELLKEWKKK